MLEKIDKTLDRIEMVVAGVIGSAMLIVTCMIVIWRYILVSPLIWGEEAARYLMICFVFWGCALAARGENHLGVEAFKDMLPPRASCVANKIKYVITIVILLVLVILSYQMFLQYMSTGQQSTMMRIPMCFIFMCVPVGLTLSLWHYIVHLVNHIHDKPEPKIDKSELEIDEPKAEIEGSETKEIDGPEAGNAEEV